MVLPRSHCPAVSSAWRHPPTLSTLTGAGFLLIHCSGLSSVPRFSRSPSPALARDVLLLGALTAHAYNEAFIRVRTRWALRDGAASVVLPLHPPCGSHDLAQQQVANYRHQEWNAGLTFSRERTVNTARRKPTTWAHARHKLCLLQAPPSSPCSSAPLKPGPSQKFISIARSAAGVSADATFHPAWARAVSWHPVASGGAHPHAVFRSHHAGPWLLTGSPPTAPVCSCDGLCPGCPPTGALLSIYSSGPLGTCSTRPGLGF